MKGCPLRPPLSDAHLSPGHCQASARPLPSLSTSQPSTKAGSLGTAHAQRCPATQASAGAAPSPLRAPPACSHQPGEQSPPRSSLGGRPQASAGRAGSQQDPHAPPQQRHRRTHSASAPHSATNATAQPPGGCAFSTRFLSLAEPPAPFPKGPRVFAAWMSRWWHVSVPRMLGALRASPRAASSIWAPGAHLCVPIAEVEPHCHS